LQDEFDFCTALISCVKIRPDDEDVSKRGALKEVGLDERIYQYDKCGLVIDRNYNSSINMKNVGEVSTEHREFTPEDKKALSCGSSRIASPGVIALHAPVELSGRLVAAPSLQEPPHRLVVAALWTFDFRGREGRELPFLLANYLDWWRLDQLLFGRLQDCLAGLVRVTTIVAEICD